MSTHTVEAAHAVRKALHHATHHLVEREAVVELIALCAVAGEHLLLIGPPGTAKSEAVRRVATVLGGRYFEYLLGRFTEPSEVFGPVDLRRLREGVVETQTTGMLPEAEVAFLDEVFLGSTAILNTLLGILNERQFRRGHSRLQCPLRVCVGASNALPEDPSLAAFADRFLCRMFLEPLADPRLEELLEHGWGMQQAPLEAAASLEQIDVLASACRNLDTSPVRPALAQAVRALRKGGIVLSDRRVVKVQKLVAAATVLAGREQPTEADLWPLVFAVPSAEGQKLARELLRDRLAQSQSPTLSAAAEEASVGPLARATRLIEAARGILEAAPAEGERADWTLRLEGIAREIDAGFESTQLPPELAAVREQIVNVLRA